MANDKKIIKKNWPRYVLNWGILAAIILFLTGIIKTETATDPETYCPMGGLQAFVTYLVRGSLPCSMSSVQIMMGLALAICVIIFSKLFCGYLCPVGTVEDLLRKGRQAIGMKSIKIKNQGIADKILRIIKYALLFWIFYMTATASELFCKNLDPYYAVATGFKGEITLWMSIVTVTLVVLGGFLIDNFWCRFICPLGAVCNTFKFWIWLIVLFGVWYIIGLVGIELPWWILLGAFCLMGYLLEIIAIHPKFQIIAVQKDNTFCNKCGACMKQCPYHINLTIAGTRINNVDCTLCGDCVAACNTQALHIGVTPKVKKSTFSIVLPALIAVAFGVAAYCIGQKQELPTINEEWGIYSTDSTHTQLVDRSKLETCTIEGLKQIHCFGSSRAFMGKLMKIKGIYGVKTYVKSHKATILYDPKIINPDEIEREIYVPSHFKCFTPDYKAVPELKVLTIRTEHMTAPSDVNFLGIQFKQVDSLIYGLDSEWDCPLIVHMYVDPAFDKDEDWIEEIVNKPTLDIQTRDGNIKSTPLGFEFVRLEKEIGTIATTEFLRKMFGKPFFYQSEKRVEEYAGKPQFIYEFADENFTKPLISRNFCFVSNFLSNYDGIIGVYTALNKDYIPSLQIRFAKPMTGDKIFELLTMDEWTITYAKDDVRQVPAKILFKKPGTVFPYVAEIETK